MRARRTSRPRAPAPFAPVLVQREDRSDGAILPRSRTPLAEHASTLVEVFEAGRTAHPDRVLVADRHGSHGGWRRLPWGEAGIQADAVAAWLATHALAGRPVMVLSGNSVEHHDVWRQAKSGPLPHRLSAEGSTPIHDPIPGEIYFWPQTDVIAIYYDDLDQAVPDPGLVRLGVVDTGPDRLANAGRQCTARIDLAAAPN